MAVKIGDYSELNNVGIRVWPYGTPPVGWRFPVGLKITEPPKKGGFLIIKEEWSYDTLFL
ncbi:MAG TPA: hypothetical protein DEO26_02350 [Candidatus Veblenbacteria bacterium]|nr:hypothetical protein [Candidatus Veblenbacteria bacterium]HCM45423.1 hypothetical protein [Candidatus Veblenbacteria bacterium]